MREFFLEKTYLPANEGYAMFSIKYFAILLLMLLIGTASIIFFSRQEEKRKEKLCRVFALVPAGMEILKFIILFSQGVYTPNYYPIGFCSLVTYIFPVYAFAKNRTVRNVARGLICMAMLPSGLLALLFPNWIGHYRFLSYFSLHSYLWHLLMVVYPFWTWLKDRERLRTINLIQGAIVFSPLIPIIVVINRVFGTNYWFLVEPTDNHPFASLYQVGGGGVYFAVLVILGYAVAGIFITLQNYFIPRWIQAERGHDHEKN